MKQTFLCLLLIISLLACTKEVPNKPDEPIVTVEAQTLKEVAYGSDALHKMDVYLPANRSTSTTKVMVLIHGGAWTEGDKGDFNTIIDSLRKKLPDWAFFNLNYRLAGYEFPLTMKNKFPAQENDIKNAVKYIYDRRTQFIISDKWVVTGASAGGHLALLQGYKNIDVIKPKAIVDLFGPTDMAALYHFYKGSGTGEAYLIELLLGGTPSGNPLMYTDSSPINFVNAQSPPTIIFHGGLDDVVPKEQSYSLQAKLNSANVKNQLVYYENQTHGWSDPAVLADSYNKIVNFLNTNVH